MRKGEPFLVWGVCSVYTGGRMATVSGSPSPAAQAGAHRPSTLVLRPTAGGDGCPRRARCWPSGDSHSPVLRRARTSEAARSQLSLPPRQPPSTPQTRAHLAQQKPHKPPQAVPLASQETCPHISACAQMARPPWGQDRGASADLFIPQPASPDTSLRRSSRGENLAQKKLVSLRFKIPAGGDSRRAAARGNAAKSCCSEPGLVKSSFPAALTFAGDLSFCQAG